MTSKEFKTHRGRASQGAEGWPEYYYESGGCGQALCSIPLSLSLMHTELANCCLRVLRESFPFLMGTLMEDF